MDEVFDSQIQEIINNTSEQFDLIGLYSVSANVGLVPSRDTDPDEVETLMTKTESDQDSVAKMVQGGELDVMMVMSFRIGEVAWSERVLNPESYEDKKEFERLMPTEQEIGKTVIIDEILNDNWDDFEI